VNTPRLQFGVRHRATADGTETVVDCTDYVEAVELQRSLAERGCVTAQVVVRTVYPWRVAV
jgi:hypothetical protein